MTDPSESGRTDGPGAADGAAPAASDTPASTDGPRADVSSYRGEATPERLREIARYFIYIGIVGFGGPSSTSR